MSTNLKEVLEMAMIFSFFGFIVWCGCKYQ